MPKKYLTDERKAELVQFAKDMHAGKIFTDRHLSNPNDVTMVFMVLALADKKTIEKIAKRIGDKGIIYEYMDKAGPMGVNGNPVFFSCGHLTDTEAEYMFTKYEEVKTTMESIT